MKNPILFLLVILICSCSSESSKSNQGASISLQITQDTVLVDPGDDIVMAGTNIWLSTLSEDKKMFYNLDRKSLKLEIFDLDELKLVKKAQFNNDGPNALSAYVISIKSWHDENLFLQGFDKSGVFDLDGNLIEKKSLHAVDYASSAPDMDFSFKSEYVFLNDSTVIIGLMSMFDNIPSLAKLHLNQQKMELIDFPYAKRIDEFSIILEGEIMMASIGSIYKHKFGDKVLLNSNYFNDCLVFDPEASDYELIEYESQLTSNKKEGGHKQKVSSRDEFTEQQKMLRKQIEFGRWVWDESSEKFFRLSYFDTTDSEESGSNKTRVFLTVFDKDLKMLAETELDSYKKRPGTYFAKDGTVWIHENVDDDLGFVRLKVAGVG
ncbi:DUF4221 domain-containing protein [Belliella sp. R4-6]|uniref:DUF4221 domain-containing protein n=1 Tax=Belliella alkalica TaxID=1730871 RepID=A0ABS9VH21_9BACT|nr:DUF4221 family protein [Belliella alkalica]MCH7415747.1 DUF4221 domain-containing protein [Belliella alkalica]